MTTQQPPQGGDTAATSTHLSVRPDGLGPREMMFDFERQKDRAVGAGLVSIGVHAVAIGVILLIGYLLPDRVYEAILPDQTPSIVFLPVEGPGGGGGGGGNKTPDPPPKEVSIPKPQIVEPKPEPPKIEPPKLDEIVIPAETLAVNLPSPGFTEAPPTATSGPGDRGGAGSGRGTGIGSGTGSGLGPGSGGGTGGGVYRPGAGIRLPEVIREVRPQYTAEAMRAKVQGTVLLEVVINPDGTVGSVEVQRSLDQAFGLDQEAIKAAKQWRFRPGVRLATGEPVPVLVTIELTFTLR